MRLRTPTSEFGPQADQRLSRCHVGRQRALAFFASRFIY